MQEELNTLKRMDTWDLVDRPRDAKVVKNRWVLTRKVNDGQTRYKARLVAKGFTQRYGIDYHDTFSPVIGMTSIRLLLSYATVHNWHIHHVDVKNAYINSPLQEEIYMQQPYMFETNHDKLVCKLKKSLYGLKQAAKCWNKRLLDILGQLELKKLKCEACIVINQKRNFIVGIYVDDLLIISSDISAIRNFKEKLKGNVQIIDKEKVTKFVGLEVEHMNNQLSISQREYIEFLVKEHEN